MPWNMKRWWKRVAIVTAVIQLTCLVISPNPLSIIVILVGMGVLGLALPSVIWSWERFSDPGREIADRAIGLLTGLFAVGVAKFGFDLVLSGVLASLVFLGWKWDGG